MNPFRIVRDFLSSHPIERELQKKLNEAGSCDAMVLFDCSAPFPGVRTAAEWLCRNGKCTMSWSRTAAAGTQADSTGTTDMPADQFMKHLADLDQLAVNERSSLRGKDCPVYSIAWYRPPGPIRSIQIRGSLVPGPCQDVIESLQRLVPRSP